MNTYFSIIIPLYNKEEYIKSTIYSVLNQSYTNYEIIIVDDGSTDKGPQIVRSIEDPRIIFYSKINGGVSSARNFGISKSKGDFICFLDSDDLWHEDYLKALNNIISKNKNVDMICSAFSTFRDIPQNSIQSKKLILDSTQEVSKVDFLYYCIKEKRCIAFTSATCIKKQIIAEHNLQFDEHISMGEDIDYWVKAACFAKNIYYNNKLLVLYRIEAHNSLCVQGKSIKKSYPYWIWYDTPYMQTSMHKKFTTRMIYTLCKEGYHQKEYSAVITTIKKIRGSYLIISRIRLLILSLIKKYVSQN